MHVERWQWVGDLSVITTTILYIHHFIECVWTRLILQYISIYRYRMDSYIHMLLVKKNAHLILFIRPSLLLHPQHSSQLCNHIVLNQATVPYTTTTVGNLIQNRKTPANSFYSENI